jgi:hypothetical protein
MALRLKISFLLLFCVSVCSAHGLAGHNDEFFKILFGDNNKCLSAKAQYNFDLLCKAAFLTLDYTTQDQGARFYADLKNSGVKGMVPLESISFSGNQYHQKYTHMGWESYYGAGNKGNWTGRKDILLKAVANICNFKTEEKIKNDAFAALVYEIHILGDHIGDMDATRYTRIRLVSELGYRGQVVNPTSDGPFNNPTLYTYMLYHIQRLFREQKNTYEYNELVKFLARHTDEYLNYNNCLLLAY